MMAEPIHFLIVDDTEDNLVALEALLRRDGLTILKARSGAEALELLLAHEVALALVDVQMPEMDGFELAELMRGAERTKHVPIIFVTAGSRDPQCVFRGYETGAVDFLFKPLDPHVLRGKADVFFELHRQRNELASALRLNEIFVGILGHDLRNPLSAVLAGAQLLERQVSGDAQLRTLQRMTAAGNRMTEMIEQLLDLTRARLAGGLGFLRTRKPLDVRALVERTAEELRQSHPERQVVVETVGDCSTVGDADRLLQLLSNLVANALEHGTAGSPVVVTVRGDHDEVIVQVKNRGTIPADALPTLFDPFRDRRRTSPRSRGLGLGLYISQQVAVAHGGHIDVASDAGGTSFAVRLPRRMNHAVAKDVERAAKILVVDDDENIRDSLREAFEEQGYDAVTAADGREALEILHDGAQRPDLVVLDLVMPAVDGWRVYETMQADPVLSKIPVVVSTSNPAGAPSGAVVLPKPLKLARLLATVAGLFPRHART